jgi:hypothetical protein
MPAALSLLYAGAQPSVDQAAVSFFMTSSEISKLA